ALLTRPHRQYALKASGLDAREASQLRLDVDSHRAVIRHRVGDLGAGELREFLHQLEDVGLAKGDTDVAHRIVSHHLAILSTTRRALYRNQSPADVGRFRRVPSVASYIAIRMDHPRRRQAVTTRADDAGMNPAQRARPEHAAHRVLVVDDNPDAADSLAMLLQALGNDVRVAYDGEEALDKALQFSPEIVLLDIGLPKM